MAGGGGYYSDTEYDELLRKVSRSRSETETQEFEIEVDSQIGSLLAEMNNRPVDKINSFLDEIRDCLGEELERPVRLLFGGSVAKHTYVDGLSDVDALVLLSSTDLVGKSPEDVKEYFFRQLKSRLGKTPIRQGRLAITIELEDAEIQLLPAMKRQNGYAIADYSGKEWASIRPRRFADVLTRMNEAMGGKGVPAIKLAKSVISSNLPENFSLSGYHIEALAVEAFRNYTGPKTPRALLTHFMSGASRRVLKPIKDRTGQSERVDDYLGPANSRQRRIVSDSVDRIARRIQVADIGQLVHEWRDILGVS